MEYWKHPAIVQAYIDNAKLPPITLPGGALVRFYNGGYAVFSPADNWTPVVNLLWTAPQLRFKTFPFSKEVFNDNFPVSRSGNSFYVDRSWKPNEDIRYAMRRADRQGLVSGEVDTPDAVDLLMRWFRWMKQRYPLQATYGHYKCMLERGEMITRGWYLDAQLVAVTAHLSLENEAIIGVLKHLSGYNWLSRAVWGKTLTGLLADKPLVWCGEASDRIKRDMGMFSYPLYRLDVKKIIQMRPADYKPRFEFDGPYQTNAGFEFIRDNAYKLE